MFSVYNNNIILIPLHRVSMGLLLDNQQCQMASNQNNEFIQTKTNVLKTNMSTLKAVMCHGVHVGLLVGLLLFFGLFLLMLSAAPGRFGRGLLAHAGRASYTPITGLRVLVGLASRLGFLRMAALLFAVHVLGVGSTLLRQTPTGHTFLRCCGKRG